MNRRNSLIGGAILVAIIATVIFLLPQKRSGVVIYAAKTVVTMEEANPSAEAIAVEAGRVVGLGDATLLLEAFPKAKIDKSFENHTIVPGLIDPHIHMLLSAVQYALPMAPPWPIATPDGAVPGYATRSAFLARLKEIEQNASGKKKPLIIYGYHDLVHGGLNKTDLDEISDTRPILVWHYSSHDFYLNSAALEWAKVDKELHEQYEGVALDDNGDLTGRIYEDALPYLMDTIGPSLINPLKVRKGAKGFSELLRQGGVTTVADLGYGILGLRLENLNIRFNWGSIKKSGHRLYLVPEHRAFAAKFDDKRVEEIQRMVSGARKTPAPVLPQVKFFVDAAFYSQTMRISAPGYLGGQSEGSEGMWVLPPSSIAETIRPYWEAGLGVRIHSNGNAAQTATLNALEELRSFDQERRFVIEHACLFTPRQIGRAAELNAAISAASHYVHYLGEAYQPILGQGLGSAISPLASLSKAGAPVTLHSDAPLAPPLPLQAASVHITRSTREGGELTPTEKLSAYEAMEAITIDAAFALGLENEIGSIAIGKKADFTILSANPLETPGEDWPEIGIWGTIIDGAKYPAPKKAPH